MQHQVANIVGSTNGKPPILLGAVVEGPNSFAAKGTLTGTVTRPPNGVDVFAKFNGNGAVYRDNVQSYSTVEPAIDLSALVIPGLRLAGRGSSLRHSVTGVGRTQLKHP
ncbi:MAG: hypothetical protein DMG76_35105 [Acidobacteria bacterium]|nr:MAG: hypothetical protein DMG76_35105 [Acidobacteriota bacterium]